MNANETIVKIDRIQGSGDVPDETFPALKERAKLAAVSELGRGVKYLRVRRSHNIGFQYRFKIGVVGK